MAELGQGELFEEAGAEAPGDSGAEAALSAVFELSADAYAAAVYAGMSGLLVKGEIARFVGAVSRAKDRRAADKAASDRGNPDTLAVLQAAYKVRHEICRIKGFLRFSPGPDGRYTARCAPDSFILPALAGHFTLRFGESPWAIIDEKRGLCLIREKGEEARLVPSEKSPPEFPPATMPPPPGEAARDGSTAAGSNAANSNAAGWEDLWRLYCRSVNNESRKNLRLQRQFVPERYRKYLAEFETTSPPQA